MCVACSTYKKKQCGTHLCSIVCLMLNTCVSNGCLFPVDENQVFLYVNECTTSISEKYKFAGNALRNLMYVTT
jgi:hypothetical protein